MESDVRQACDVVFKKVNAALGKQKAASIQVKKIASEQLMESVEVKQMLTLRPTLLKGFDKLERELKKC